MSETSTTTSKTGFECHAPDANEVFLAGTFNDWQPDATPMAKDEAGLWATELELSSGRHEFKFVVDGEWCCEPGCEASSECPKCIPNDVGSMNRYIDVE